METLIIAVLAAAALAEFIALVIAYRRLRGFEGKGTYDPGKDCLLVTYYYLDADRITGDRATDLQNAEKVQVQYPIEELDKLLSANDTYDEMMRKIHSSSPPPSSKTLIGTDVTIIHDCTTPTKKP